MSDPTAEDVYALARSDGWCDPYTDSALAAFAIELGTLAAAERDLLEEALEAEVEHRDAIDVRLAETIRDLAETVRLLREALDILNEHGVALMRADIFLAEHEDIR